MSQTPIKKQELINTLRVGWFLALRQLKRSNKWTTFLIISIMVLTFLNLVVVSGLLLGLISGSFVQFRDNYSGDVLVTSAEGHTYIPNSNSLISFVESNEHVERISPRYVVSGQILGTLDRLPKKEEKANEAGVAIAGYNPLLEEKLTGFSRFILKGAALEPGDTNGILIGANMLKNYSSFADANIPGLTLLEDVDVGSRVRVTIAQEDGGRATKDFVVRGIVKSKVDEISTRAFILDTEVRRLLPARKLEVQEISIQTTPGYAEQVVADIKDFTGVDGPRVQTYQEAIPSFLRDIETTMGVLGNALSSIALVVATITIFIVIFINAVTKRKFIGIMKGVGISPLSIEFSYVLQAFFYGAVGSAIGALLTFGFLKPFFTANPIDFPFSDGILVVTPAGATVRIIILLVVSLLAGYIPAKLIVRKNTLDAILGR